MKIIRKVRLGKTKNMGKLEALLKQEKIFKNTEKMCYIVKIFLSHLIRTLM